MDEIEHVSLVTFTTVPIGRYPDLSNTRACSVSLLLTTMNAPSVMIAYSSTRATELPFSIVEHLGIVALSRPSPCSFATLEPLRAMNIIVARQLTNRDFIELLLNSYTRLGFNVQSPVINSSWTSLGFTTWAGQMASRIKWAAMREAVRKVHCSLSHFGGPGHQSTASIVDIDARTGPEGHHRG